MQNSAPDADKARLKAQVPPEEQLSQQDKYSTGIPEDAIVHDPVPVEKFPGADETVQDDSQFYATSAMDYCLEDQTGRYDIQTTITVAEESEDDRNIF